MKNFLILLLMGVGMLAHSQVAINTDGSSPDNSAIFDVKSSNKGVLLPRMTQAQRNAIAGPATGLMIYQTDNTPGVYYNSGTGGSPAWVMAGGVTGWGLTGNSGTNPATNFIGTTDNVALNFRVNDQKAGRISSDGSLFLGYQAGNISTGAYNTGMGFQALNSNTTGSYNTATGNLALYSNISGTENTANGIDALIYNTTGSYNTADGSYALYSNTSGSSNTASGWLSLFSNTEGAQNTAYGVSALYHNTTGVYNTANGAGALYYNTEGEQNTADGVSALAGNTTGINNTAVGIYSMVTNNIGNDNTATGKSALYSNTTGSENAANGNSALHSNETGWGNTACGFSALPNNTTGNWNTALGHTAGTGNTVGQFNTFIGTNTSGSSGLTNATAIGYNAQVTQSNSLVLGNNASVGIGISAPSAKLDVRGNVPDDGAVFQIGNSDLSHRVLIFGGKETDPNPFIHWKDGDPLRFTTDQNGWSEKMRITSSGQVGIGTDAPAAKLDVHGTFSVVDGTQGAGKVLTSDAGGLASWTTGTTHAIGESYGGGIVFYVYDGGHHGLIAPTSNQGMAMRWYAGTNTSTMAMADGVGAGKANTAIIIANQGYGDGATYAARICNEYSVTVGDVTYGDWYLPSKFELNLLYLEKSVVGGFANDHCCSSSEANSTDVWIQAFLYGGQSIDAKWKEYSVRAIRAF